jgi:tRNA C32,U32 (ribose-2'-O)-methylase TrmJ
MLSLVRLPAWNVGNVEQKASYWRRTAVVVGNERTGISNPWFEHASGEITIPMLGRADSLNVAVSASILMYDIRSVLSGAARARASDRRRVGAPLIDGRQLAL